MHQHLNLLYIIGGLAVLGFFPPFGLIGGGLLLTSHLWNAWRIHRATRDVSPVLIAEYYATDSARSFLTAGEIIRQIREHAGIEE